MILEVSIKALVCGRTADTVAVAGVGIAPPAAPAEAAEAPIPPTSSGDDGKGHTITDIDLPPPSAADGPVEEIPAVPETRPFRRTEH